MEDLLENVWYQPERMLVYTLHPSPKASSYDRFTAVSNNSFGEDNYKKFKERVYITRGVSIKATTQKLALNSPNYIATHKIPLTTV